jgi:CubicO group peptidase (beta-lactamase class C family)
MERYLKDKHPEVMNDFPPERNSQVTFSNYTRPAFNTWGFRNIDSVTHTAMLPRGGALPIIKEHLDPLLPGKIIEDGNGDRLPLDALLEKHDADGFLMMRNGNIVYENYWNGLTAQDRHIWFSMTKSLVSTAFGILMTQIDIDLTKSPAYYIEELKGSGFERTTIQDVLNHASAIAFKENYVDPESEFLRYYAPALNMGFIPGAQDVQPHEEEIYGVYDFLAKFVKPELAEKPGVAFEYNSTNADLIGWMISRLSGIPLQSFLARYLWSKLGTNHDGAIVVDRAYQPVATGGMTSTLRDAALFGQLILNKGKANGEQVVPESWIAETLNLTDADQQRYANNGLYKNEFWQYYKNMWWILDPEKREYAAVGIHGQVIYINGSTNTVISQFSSQPTAGQVGSVEFRSKLLAIRALANQD